MTTGIKQGKNPKAITEPLLTLTLADGSTAKVFILNPGEHFPEFGGSRHALICKGTASVIVRSTGSMGLTDVGYDVNDPRLWAWFAMVMSAKDKRPKVTGPKIDE